MLLNVPINKANVAGSLLLYSSYPSVVVQAP